MSDFNNATESSKVDVMRKALEFYANKNNYTAQGVLLKTARSGPFSGGMRADFGEIARTALANGTAAQDHIVDANKMVGEE